MSRESAQITLILSVKIAFRSISRTICSRWLFLSFMRRCDSNRFVSISLIQYYVGGRMLSIFRSLNLSVHIHRTHRDCLCVWRWKWSVAAYSLYTYTTQSARVYAWIDVSVYSSNITLLPSVACILRWWYFVGLAYRIFESPPLNLGDLDSLTHYVYRLHSTVMPNRYRLDHQFHLFLSLSTHADKLHDTGHAYSFALTHTYIERGSVYVWCVSDLT